jgi:flagellar basal-body rod protein FlgG
MPTSLNELWNVSASGIFARQRQVQVISHNVANANTLGFRAGQAGFQALVQDVALGEEEAAVFEAAQPGDVIQDWRGTYLAQTTPLFNQGALEETGHASHMAIAGDGFFQVSLPDGTLAYTRAGDFRRDAAGEWVTASGARLAPPVVIPEDVIDVYVDPRGQILGRAAGEDELAPIGQVEIATFPNADGLARIGDTLFAATPASGPADLGLPGEAGRGTLFSGYVEGSNVDLGSQMVDLMRAQRNYSLNLRALRTADEMYRLANDISRP